MATYSKSTTYNPYDSNFYITTSGSGTLTQDQTFVTVPAGKVLVLTQVATGANITIQYINISTTYRYQLSMNASTIKDFAGIRLGPGTYTMNITISGAYSWTATGHYETLNT